MQHGNRPLKSIKELCLSHLTTKLINPVLFIIVMSQNTMPKLEYFKICILAKVIRFLIINKNKTKQQNHVKPNGIAFLVIRYYYYFYYYFVL